MVQQEAHIATPPIFRLVDTMRVSISHVLDWIAGCSAQDQDEDRTRRCRLLVASILVIFVFAQFFLYKQVYAFEGFPSPTAWVLVCGSGLMLLNLPLLRRTRCPPLPSKLFVCELIVSFGLMAYYNGGYDSAALIWNLTIPLLAVVLVGPGFGFLCAGLIIVETVIFYVLTQAGYPFPQPLTTAQNRWFHFFGSINLIVCVALAGWLYEVLHKNAIARAKQAHWSLERSEAYFRSLIEQSSDFIAVLHADGMMRYYSPSHEHLLGYAPGELLRRNPFELIAPEDRQELQQRFLDEVQNQTPSPPQLFTFQFRHHDGSWRVLEGIATNLLHDPAVAGLVVNSRDITERQRAEEALRDSEQRYRSIVELAPEVIFILNTEGVITALNPAFETLTGRSREQFLGQPFAPVLHPDDLPQAMEYLHRLLAGEALPLFELRILHQQGKIIIGEFTVTPQTRNGQVVRILGIARDITHRKEVERLKNELVSTVSHELRTPLASLRGFTELMLAREFPPAQQREFLTIIQKESIRLTNLINDFLDLERSASGRQVYSFSQIALDPLLQEAIAMVSAESSQHPCSLELSPPLPPVQGDADRLRQVLLNLLTNAIKYSPHGGAVRVGARRDGQKVVLWVSDQGIGIPPDARVNLFQKFYRVDNAETRRIGGTGLGLVLVKEIIQAHGGEVWVDSEVGLGSTFFFSLPVPEDKPSQTAPRPTTDRGQNALDAVSGKNDSSFYQQESPKYGEDLTQPIDRVLGSQYLSSGT